MLLRLLSLTLCSSLLLAAAGCANVQRRDARDAPWDPRPGVTMMDQIPNWEGGAGQVCCGHLRSCKAHQTPTC